MEGVDEIWLEILNSKGNLFPYLLGKLVLLSHLFFIYLFTYLSIYLFSYLFIYLFFYLLFPEALHNFVQQQWDPKHRPCLHSGYWTGTNFQWMLAFEKTPRIILSCKLVPVYYQENEYSLLYYALLRLNWTDGIISTRTLTSPHKILFVSKEESFVHAATRYHCLSHIKIIICI